MEIFIAKDIMDLLVSLYLIGIIVIMISIANRIKKIRRIANRMSHKPTETKLGFFNVLKLVLGGIVALFGVYLFTYSILKIFWILVMLGIYIYLLNLTRRICPFCRNKVKDNALVCSHCSSDISDSFIFKAEN